jgi:DNA-binding PadR family transcriptional regulator
MTDLTAIETVLLAAISDRPRYGYELVQRMSELTDGDLQVRPGNLYRVLHRLMERGLVKEIPSAAGSEEDERRRYFGATALGRRAAAAELAMYARVLKRAPALKEVLSDA